MRMRRKAKIKIMIKCHWEKDIGLELCIDTVSIVEKKKKYRYSLYPFIHDSIDRVSHAASTQRLCGIDVRRWA